jgi:hypothetical protein
MSVQTNFRAVDMLGSSKAVVAPVVAAKPAPVKKEKPVAVVEETVVVPEVVEEAPVVVEEAPVVDPTPED